MSDFDLDWGMEHELHVDHDGGVDHGQADDHYNHHDLSETHAYDDVDSGVDVDHEQHDEPPGLDEQEPDLPEWQLDTDFLDGHYDLVGADPHEHDMWSQFMTDMHEEINPYAAN
jgi:hypothetical protein